MPVTGFDPALAAVATVGGDVSMTIFRVAKPSLPVAGRVSTAALPTASWILPPLSTKAAVEV